MEGTTSKRARWAAAGLMLLGAAWFAACNDDDDDGAGDRTPAGTQTATQAASADEQAIRQAFVDAFARWNAKDLDGFLQFFTDEGVVSSFGEEGGTVAEAKANLESFLGTQDLGNAEFQDWDVTGETASVDAHFSLGPVLLHSKFGLIKVGGDWKVKSEDSNLPVDLPSGATAIEVDLKEFEFGTDTGAITAADGAFGFEAKNVGKQAHMLAIARVPADANIEELLGQEDAPGIEFLTGTDDVAPGSSSSVVFVRPLDAGRYIMVCFLPDTDEGDEGTPHFLKGMLKEFTVN